MEQIEFTAWSLYTGPAYLKSIINDPNCPWVVGAWDGINNNTTAQEIKKDIDERISMLLYVFNKTLPMYKTYNRLFVVPEFFFHCKQGPYPYIKPDGLNYSLEYIALRLKTELKKIIPNDNNYYEIIIGSVLTSNIEDYTSFLNSYPVTQRLLELNSILAEKPHLLKSQQTGHWSRHLSNYQQKSSNDLDALNNFMKTCRANPLCTVRNRGVCFHVNQSLMSDIETFVYEKQYESTVDLTMGMYDAQNKIIHGGMITEWMANYPSYSILSGDKQTDKFSTNARFSPQFFGNFDMGVEICLDHRLQRLKRTVDMCILNGATANNYPLMRQLLPSGGMQILDYSVAADKSCVIFNADGCDKIYKVYGDESTVILNGQAGTFKGITCGVYNQSVQSKWTGKDGNTYYSHSQLAFTTHASVVSGFNNALGLNNPKASTYEGSSDQPSNVLTDNFKPQIIKLGEDSELFNAGPGELHYYEPL